MLPHLLDVLGGVVVQGPVRCSRALPHPAHRSAALEGGRLIVHFSLLVADGGLNLPGRIMNGHAAGCSGITVCAGQRSSRAAQAVLATDGKSLPTHQGAPTPPLASKPLPPTCAFSS